MRLQEVGGLKKDEQQYLHPDWYTRLTEAQLMAYVRYLFIYYKEGESNWEEPAHTKRRPMWDGGADRYGVKHKSVWQKIVKLIRATKANPGLWVAAHFSHSLFSVRMAQNKGVIQNRPELLAAENSAEIYRDYCDHFNEMTLQRFNSAEVSISTRFKITEAFNLPQDDHFLMVVCDTSHVNAAPFFRHAFSSEMGCRRGVQRYIWPAALEYEVHQTLYDNFIEINPEFEWLVTDDLKKIVAGIRKHWRQYDE